MPKKNINFSFPELWKLNVYSKPTSVYSRKMAEAWKEKLFPSLSLQLCVGLKNQQPFNHSENQWLEATRGTKMGWSKSFKTSFLNNCHFTC
jgi:hypothetical protein